MNISIPRIKNTDLANADTFNTPISAIESSLNAINDTVSGALNKSSVIIYSVPAHLCFIGALVYFDVNLHAFRPAIASAVIGTNSDGKYVNAPEASVVGMVINMPSTGVADILLSGQYTSTECVKGCLTDIVTGSHYLSSSEPGKASPVHNGLIVQPVLTYTGGSSFILQITHQMPSQYQGSVLRGIMSTSDLVDASVNESGVVEISGKAFSRSDIQLSPLAVSNIHGSKFSLTPVASSVSGVGRIEVISNEFGEYFVGTKEDIGGRFEATAYNLNGSKRSSDNIFTYIIFPSGKTSAVTISRHVDTGAATNVIPWVDLADTPETTLRIDSYFVPDDVPESGIILSDIQSEASSISVSQESAVLKTYTATEPIVVTESGTLFVSITAEEPTDDIKMLRAGITLNPVKSLIDFTTIDNKGSLIASAVVSDSVDGYISKDTVVGVNNKGEIVPASSNDSSIPAVGVAINDAQPGEICKYTAYGIHRTDKPLTFGAPYYVGGNGELTSIANNGSFMIRVGDAIGEHTLKVSIEERIA